MRPILETEWPKFFVTIKPKSIRFSPSKLRVRILFVLSQLKSTLPCRQFQMEEIDDMFESSLNLEEIHFKEGYSEGYEHGLDQGKEEGQQVGLKVGFEVGEELGFYRGCINVWNSVIQVDPTRFSDRVQKMIKQMDELVAKYPVMDPENESIQGVMDGLRLKFRAVCATLNVKLEYIGYPKTAQDSKEFEF
ncbi:hypothetical protein ACJW31_06G212600 [Castanea mollissima]